MSKIPTLALLAGVAASLAIHHGAASAQQSLDPAGRDALMVAMRDEAFASAKYKLLAEYARLTGDKALADRLAVAANMEMGHFLRWAKLYRLVGADAQNLQAAVRDEIGDDVKLYERLASEADARGDKALAEHFQLVKAQEEKAHREFGAPNF